MTSTGSGEGGCGGDMTENPGADGLGSLARIVQVDPWQVAKVGALFSFCIILPLLLFVNAHSQVVDAPKHEPSPIQAELWWGLVLASLAVAMAIALAYTMARLKALAKLMEQAIDNLPMQFAYVDVQCRYRFNNKAYLKANGQEGKSVYGQTMRRVLGEEIYRQIAPRMDRALSGQRVNFELKVSHGADTSDLAVTYLPDVTADGQVKGVFMLASDISKPMRVDRREKEQLLELTYLSRMAGLGEVATEVAHQINQPLAAIAMFSSAAERTLASGGDTGPVLGWLASINAQSKRASEVIGSLRRFARPDKVNKTELDLNVPLHEVALLLAQDAASRQIGLNLELTTPLPSVLATSVLIEQVIFNLVRNAILAAGQDPPGQVTLRSHADVRRVWVEVLHTGPCLCADLPVGACEQDGTPSNTGLGFNLTVSRSIIAEFDGEIGCCLDDSGGENCFFHLPRCEP